MRIVIFGTTAEAVMTARLVIERGHEVVIIEEDAERIDELSEELDCSFLHGDGSHPSVLRETDPKESDVFFCLTDRDQANILASLVGESLGFKRIITSVQDPNFEELCGHLGIEEAVVPSRMISRHLGDLVEGLDILELRTVIKGEARFFSFTARDEERGKVSELHLPEMAKVICLYREDEFILAEPDTRIHTDDEVVILTHSRHIPDLRERWNPKSTDA